MPKRDNMHINMQGFKIIIKTPHRTVGPCEIELRPGYNWHTIKELCHI